MFVLPNGKPYEAGSRTDTAILDPSGTGTGRPARRRCGRRTATRSRQAMYRPGKILRAGGGDPAIARTAVIDMNAASPAWREIDPMANARRRMNLTILADGTVLAIGGTASADSEAAAVLATEIWNPDTEKWTTVVLDGRGTHVPLVGGAPAGRAGGRRGRRGRRPAASPDLLAAVSLQGCPADDLGRRRGPPPGARRSRSRARTPPTSCRWC